MRFIEGGLFLRKPACVQQATEAYRLNNDWLQAFISDCCQTGNDLEAPSAQLYTAYKAYAEAASDYVRKPREFKTALEKSGYETVKRAAGSMIQGLRLLRE